MQDPRPNAAHDETERLINTTRHAASELREQIARSHQTIAESREVIRLIASSGVPRLSSDLSD